MGKRAEAAYRNALKTGLLGRRAAEARQRLSRCRLCPRDCGANRLEGELGFCRTGRRARVASAHPHFGEEDPLVGERGSGTVFFSFCNLLCLFCQNFEISHGGEGREVSDEELARILLAVQEMGCHNINLVSPSHVVPQILAAVAIAAEQGLDLPLVYNTGGYDRVETLALLDGIVDIYMPDFKFWDPEVARASCQAPDYPEVARAALKEMHRQVGDLVVDEEGIARRGLIVRHLVLPGGLAGTREVMGFIAREISPSTYVNLLSQYRPCGRAREVEGLERALSAAEFRRAVEEARAEGITRLDRPLRGLRWP
ncbi:MAG: radical SAM protein [Desulfobacterales bacterium]